MNSFIHSISKEYSEVLQDGTYRIISDEELYILFESNRQQLLANCNLYESNTLTTKTILRNIRTLQSLDITPQDYSNRLNTLLKGKEIESYKHYVDFATVYALYDQFLQDRKLITPNTILSKLIKDECTLNTIAKVPFTSSSSIRNILL